MEATANEMDILQGNLQLEWEKEDAWKLERKPLGVTLEWRQLLMKWIYYKVTYNFLA